MSSVPSDLSRPIRPPPFAAGLRAAIISIRPSIWCAVILIVHALLLVWAATANSATFDEPAHLAAGVNYWRNGDFSIYSLSPPLLRLWGALPAVLAGAKAPPAGPFWQYSLPSRHWVYADAFSIANLSSFARLLWLSRLFMIPISCVAGWICYRWAGELFGSADGKPGAAAGLAACLIYCVSPSVLAHAPLVTTDIGTMTAMLATAWLWWRYCRRPSWRLLLAVAVAATVAHLCKFTAVLLWPMMLAMSLPLLFGRWRFFSSPGTPGEGQGGGFSGDSQHEKPPPQPSPGVPREGERRRRDCRGTRPILLGWLFALAMTVIAINAVYGFRGNAQPLASFHFTSNFMLGIQKAVPHLPSPLPATYLLGFDAQKTDTQAGYQSFLFGEIYQHTVWYYYPAALLCKLPISFLVLLACAVASVSWRRCGTGPPGSELSVLVGGTVYLAGVLVAGDVNIGTRYLLPALPFAAILVARLWCTGPIASANPADPPSQPPGRSAWRWIRDGLLTLLAIESLAVAPRFISFINFAFGGPSEGWRLLTDSDFDWGQSLIDLRHWMTENKVDRVKLAYFGYADPRAYGIRYTAISEPSNDAYVVISAYFLDGLSKRILVASDERVWWMADFYPALQAKTPVAVVGHTLFIYRQSDVIFAQQLSRANLRVGP